MTDPDAPVAEALPPLFPSIAAASEHASSPPRHNQILLHRFAMVALLIFATLAAVLTGIRLRQWAWAQTQPIHFQPDIRRGFKYGTLSTQRGYLEIYDDVAEETASGEYQELDYAPLRLALMTLWARDTQHRFPDWPQGQWRWDYSFNRLPLMFNTFTEAMGALAVFLLVRRWQRGPLPSMLHVFPLRAFLGAMIYWYSPASILSTHGWPTWDEWIMPFYLWGILLASFDWWFTAGIVIAVGTMFKGQQFFVAGIFIFWPIFAGRWSAAPRWLAGFIFAFGAIASPWLLAHRVEIDGSPPFHEITWPAVRFVAAAMILFTSACLLGRVLRSRFFSAKPRLLFGSFPPSLPDPSIESSPSPAVKTAQQARRARRRRFVLASAASALILAFCYAFIHAIDPLAAQIAAAIALGIAVFSPLISPRRLPMLLVALLGASLLSCIPLLGASAEWFKTSFGYGTYHWEVMVMGLTDNLPGILGRVYHWRINDIIYHFNSTSGFTLRHFYPDLTTKGFLFLIYVATLLLCSIGAALHDRRRDPRFVVAIATPWLMFFCLPCQIHERYLLYAAGVGAATIAVSAGFALLDLFLVVVTFIMTIDVMLTHSVEDWHVDPNLPPILLTHDRALSFFHLIIPTFPGLGWGVLTVGAIFLFVTLTPSSRRGSSL